MCEENSQWQKIFEVARKIFKGESLKKKCPRGKKEQIHEIWEGCSVTFSISVPLRIIH